MREVEVWYHAARSPERVPERAQKAIREGEAQLQERPQHSGDVSTMGQLPRTAAGVEWSGPESIKQAVLCCKQQI